MQPEPRPEAGNHSYFAPLVDRRRRLVFAGLTVFWLVSITVSVIWWFDAVQSASTAGLIINSSVLAFDAVLLPLWVFFFARRMRRPLPVSKEVVGRVAMVVTKAPSEGWPLVRETLEAMLAQDFPHEYDVWLADEDPDEQTMTWCGEHEVGVTTRRGVAEYHQVDWPRRTKSKEGNLAYFYDTVGYENYDLVAQLDADHVPAPDYLEQIVRPFSDPKVGYVAAPSICDSNASRSWSARGRLYSEAMLHGAIQAGCNDGWAPSCIGSHYAVRTTALKEIGGLGPELAEDFSTTLAMSAQGWEGAFAIDAEAHGEGPETLADCVTQDFQWSRSMMVLGLTVAPVALRKASWRARARLGSCLAWYPLYALVMVASFAIPIVALVSGVAPVEVRLGGFYLHLFLPLSLLIAAAYWLRYCGALRPQNAKIISWEIVLFQLVRWPWAFFGCVQAVIGRVTGRQFSFKVTPKGPADHRPLPLRVILPYLGISLISGLCVILVNNPGGAAGYYFLALINTLLYLVVAASVLVLHLREQHRSLPDLKALLTSAAPRAAAVSLVGLVSFGALIVNGATALSTITGGAGSGAKVAAPSPYPLEADPRARVAIGVTTDAGARNVETPFEPAQLNEVNNFERAVKTHAGITMWFADWAHGVVDPEQLEAVDARGSVPEITWEPWDHSVGKGIPQPEYSLASIAAGNHDDYLQDWAATLRDFGKPVMLRFAQEMNVPETGYPWALPTQNGSGKYVAAWRHIHDLFQEAGATNVRWVWSPLASGITSEFYPGDSYVDVVGLSGFNGGSVLPWNGWRSFNRIFGDALPQVAKVAPGKPVQISEVSTTYGPGTKEEWVAAMFRAIEDHPEIRSVVWFNVAKEADWRIQTSSGAERSFAEAMTDPRYGGLPYP